jgi:hypothetical protein
MMLWKDDYKKLIQTDKEGEDYGLLFKVIS